jgi:hypothetical protein
VADNDQRNVSLFFSHGELALLSRSLECRCKRFAVLPRETGGGGKGYEGVCTATWLSEHGHHFGETVSLAQQLGSTTTMASTPPAQESSPSPPSSSLSPSMDAELKARAKDRARGSRFRFRNFAEYQLRQDLKDEALEICNPEVKAFAECAEEKGFMVVFSCQSIYKKVNECLSLYAGEEAWQKFKAENEEEIEYRATGGK